MKCGRRWKRTSWRSPEKHQNQTHGSGRPGRLRAWAIPRSRARTHAQPPTHMLWMQLRWPQPQSRKLQRPPRQPCLRIPKAAWNWRGVRICLAMSWGLARSWWGQQRSPCGGGRDRSVLIGRSAHLRGAQSPASRQSRPWPGPTRPPHQGQRHSSRSARIRGPWCQCRRCGPGAQAAAGRGWAVPPPAGRRGREDLPACRCPAPVPAGAEKGWAAN
mmetsp:Transcript_11658/g.36042  ORF Transcript_11658/g.36042 Transcript_11658/m.36042 type:complete len:216 (+) Transcript_11658:63-710(+)